MIYLPDEVIQVILSKCPAKSVLRFKSVSKSWLSIISDPQFPRIHRIQRSSLPENHNRFLIWESAPKPHAYNVYLIKLEENAQFRRESVLPYPSATYFFPLCSSNALILLSTLPLSHRYTLWNPSTGTLTTVGSDDNGYPTNLHPRIHHLYHDPQTEDHKLVLVGDRHYTTYSRRNGDWDQIKELPCNLTDKYRAAAVDGCFYTLGDGGVVNCFDARDGELSEFRQPNGVKFRVQLGAVSGRLCLYGLSRDRRRLELWVMERNGSFEKRWKKLIGMEKEEADLWMHRPEYLTSEDDVGLLARDGPGLGANSKHLGLFW